MSGTTICLETICTVNSRLDISFSQGNNGKARDLVFFMVCDLLGKTRSQTLFFDKFKSQKIRFLTKIYIVSSINGIYVGSYNI